MNRLTKTLLLSVLLSGQALASPSLVQSAHQQQVTEHQHDNQRTQHFAATEAQLKQQQRQLERQKAQLQNTIDALSAQFNQNETTLAKLSDQLKLESGVFGEMFGVVRENAKDFNHEKAGLVTSADHHQYQQAIDHIIQAKTLPSLAQLTSLWRGYQAQILAAGHARSVPVTYVAADGEKQQRNIFRIGAIAAMTPKGFVHWDGAKRQAMPYPVQPADAPNAETMASLQSGKTTYMTLDPSKGVLLSQLATAPTFTDRIKAGGVIGGIIIALLVIGLLIALLRGWYLLTTKKKINHQLKHPDELGRNPLANILKVYRKEQNQTVEALELRLVESVMDEQANLEKGLSLLKLLAALAPMLGLLGTVTGMIETFQVITEYGNGDPKVMAGGISMALVTTVLGLVAAMPLLLAHNLLSSQAENIRNILEKQGIGLVAEQAEKEQSPSDLERAA